jgi:hypothetical protein
MPTLLQQTRFALGELGVRPHKQFGQHFLIDPTVIDRMIAAARIKSDETILCAARNYGFPVILSRP